MEYEEIILETFLKEQEKLFKKPVAETLEEADEFLIDCMAQVFQDIKEVKEYLEEAGVDIEEMSEEDLKEVLEVFSVPDGRYLVVEA